jgi:hypothetical protein
MRALGPDPGYHGLEYFELAAAQVTDFLRD